MVTSASGQLVPNAPPNRVTDISQTETSDLLPNGQVVQGYRVYFKTERGVSGSVFVARSMYSVANVQAAIQAHAHQLDQVQALGG